MQEIAMQLTEYTLKFIYLIGSTPSFSEVVSEFFFIKILICLKKRDFLIFLVP